jgi:hypothetical protein
MTVEEIHDHGRTNSKTYQSKKSLWKTNPPAAERKTVLRLLLNRWADMGPGAAAMLQDEEIIEGEMSFTTPDAPPAPARTAAQNLSDLGFEDSDATPLAPPPSTAPTAASAPAGGNGNGHAAALETLLRQLWPGLDRKATILAACNNSLEEAAALCANRLAALSTADGIKTHIAKSWPGLDGVIDQLPGGYDPAKHPPLKILSGISQAKLANPKPTLNDALAAIAVEFEIPQEFAQ